MLEHFKPMFFEKIQRGVRMHGARFLPYLAEHFPDQDTILASELDVLGGRKLVPEDVSPNPISCLLCSSDNGVRGLENPEPFLWIPKELVPVAPSIFRIHPLKRHGLKRLQIREELLLLELPTRHLGRVGERFILSGLQGLTDMREELCYLEAELLSRFSISVNTERLTEKLSSVLLHLHPILKGLPVNPELSKPLH
jgi:hypothetical protein